MTRFHPRFTMLVILGFVAAATLRAQVPTGVPPFSSTGGGPDIVNEANLNVHISVPVVQKAGRGIPFSYTLNYDSSIWTPTASAWTPNNTSSWGWRGATESLVGYTTYKTTAGSCNSGGQWYNWNVYDSFAYRDSSGASHPFNIAVSSWSSGWPCGSGGPPASATGVSTDSSGFTLSVTAGAGAPTVNSLKSRSGFSITAPLQSPSGSGTLIDSNGNKVNTDGTNFYDTLDGSNYALNVTGSGTPGSPKLYKYRDPSGAVVTVTVNYTAFTIRTNFGCSGISEYAPTTANLVSSIVFPDNSTYSLTYETTPGFSSNKTGRIASVTLPTGGTINYAYTGSNNGIVCTDGSTRGMTRTVAPGGSQPSGTWTYTRTWMSGAHWKTVVRNPESKENTIRFQGIYETERRVYDGLEFSTELGNVLVCYNGNFSDCTNTAITPPITRRTVWTSLGGVASSKRDEYYNTYGLTTRIDEFNYGQTLVRKTLISYATLGNGIYDRQSSVVICSPSGTDSDCGGSGTVVSKSTFAYGNTVEPTSGTPQLVSVSGDRGNLVTITRTTKFSPLTTISRDLTYFDTGNVRYAYDFIGGTSRRVTYNYADATSTCGNAFPTSTSLPLSLSTSTAWNCNGGAPTSVTDANGRTTAYSYDSLWRPTQTSLPDGGQATADYSTLTAPTVTTKLTSSVNRVDQAYLDGSGRVTQSVLVDPEGNVIVDTGYDATGRISSVSNPYRSTSETSYGTQTFGYDGMNRKLLVSNPDTTTRSIAYGEGVSGSGVNTTQLCSAGTYGLAYPTLLTDETGKRREFWTDALGRTIEVDEPDSSGSLTLNTCYSYDVLGNLTGVTQGSQTRTYQYDAIGRLTSVTTPESGQTTYTYNNNSSALTRVSPKPNQTGSTTVTTTYTYDELDRMKSKSYDDGTPRACYFYDETSVTVGSWTSTTLTNTKGRLSHSRTTTDSSCSASATPQTATVHSYDAVGRASNHWQCTPHNCSGSSKWGSSYSYNLAGDLVSWVHPSDSTGFQITHTINAAQRITKITSNLVDSTHPASLAEEIKYHPFGAVKQFRNGAISGQIQQVENYSFNKRLQLHQLSVGDYAGSWRSTYCYQYNFYQGGSLPSDCTGTISAGTSANNGSILNYRFEDNRNSNPSPDMDHTVTTLNYDSLNRLTTSIATGSKTHNLDFTYDRWGNADCVSDGATDGPCANWSFDTSKNRISTSGISHDAAGNTTADGTGSGSNAYAWDAEGRMKTVTPSGGSTTNYIYNALGQRVEVYAGTTYTEIVYDAFGNQVGLHNRTAWVAHYIPFGGRAFAKYQSGKTYFLHPNHLGSTTMITDETGATIQKTIYYPWGQAWAATTTIKDNRFASMGPRDSESANDPTLFRMFNPRLYRWLSPDPQSGRISTPQSLNRYAYVLGNPANFVDPLGLDCSGSPLNNYNPECYPGRTDYSGGSIGVNGGSSGCMVDGNSVPCQVVQGLVTMGGASPAEGGGYIPGLGLYQPDRAKLKCWGPADDISCEMQSTPGFFMAQAADSAYGAVLGQAGKIFRGGRLPGQSFAECVEENLSLTTGGNIQSGAKVLVMAMTGIALAVAKSPIPEVSGGEITLAVGFTSLHRMLGSPLGARAGSWLAARIGVNGAPVLTAAGIASGGLIAGSAGNCGAERVGP